MRMLTKFTGKSFWMLEDVNPYYYNCGHYPEWVAKEREGQPSASQLFDQRGRQLCFGTKEEAEAMAIHRNRASSQAWHDFLNA